MRKLVTVLALCFFAGVGQAADKSAPPKDLEPTFPEVTCDNYVKELEQLKSMEMENITAFAFYMDDTRNMLEQLHKTFRKYESAGVALPKGSTQILRDRTDQIDEVQGVAYSNANILDQRFDAILKVMAKCNKKD